MEFGSHIRISRSGNHGGLTGLTRLSNISVKSPTIEKNKRKANEQQNSNNKIITAKFKILVMRLNLQYIIVRTKNQKELHSNTGETASPEV